MKHTLILAAGLAFTGGIAAQDKTPPQPVESASKPSAAKRLETLRAKLEADIQGWMKERSRIAAEAEKAKADGKPIPAIPMRPPMDEFLTGFVKAAEEFKGSDDAAPFLVEIVESALGSDIANSSLKQLVDRHAGSPELTRIGRQMQWWPQILGEDEAKAAMAKISAATKNADVKGWILFANHSSTIENAALDSEAYKTARTALMALKPKLEDKGLAAEIEGAINVREKFGMGNVASDIVGVDLDGQEFKLSDYKGKIVFLDFWGDW